MLVKRTLQQLAQEACDVQDTSNIIGIVGGFAKALIDLHALFPKEGTDFIRTHFITVAWADKVNSLCGITTAYGDPVDVQDAHEKCYKVAKITE